VLAVTPLDLVFNVAEGWKGRNREAQVPSLLELLDIPYTGSDPAPLSLALDKALAGIGDTLLEIYKSTDTRGISTAAAADVLAEERLKGDVTPDVGSNERRDQ